MTDPDRLINNKENKFIYGSSVFIIPHILDAKEFCRDGSLITYAVRLSEQAEFITTYFRDRYPDLYSQTFNNFIVVDDVEHVCFIRYTS